MSLIESVVELTSLVIARDSFEALIRFLRRNPKARILCNLRVRRVDKVNARVIIATIDPHLKTFLKFLKFELPFG